MDSFLVVYNQNGESCVCTGIRRVSEAYLSLYNNERGKRKRLFDDNLILNDLQIMNHAAGNLSSLNVFNFTYKILGSPAIVVVCIGIGKNYYNVFWLDNSANLCCELNSKIEITDTEKKLIEAYNSTKCDDDYRLEVNSKDFSILLLRSLHIYEASRDINTWWTNRTECVREKVLNAVSDIKISLVQRDKIDEQLRFIKDLSISESGIHHLYKGGGCIKIEEPIKWSGLCDYRHDFDGHYQRYHGTQQIGQMNFKLPGLCDKCFDKIISLCKKQEIKITKIKGSNDVYEFYGSIDSLPMKMAETSYDDYYEPDFELPVW